MSTETLQILLVEDNDAHIELIRRAFEPHGKKFKLTVVNRLAKAKKILKKISPDLLIVDFLLPDGDGLDLLPGSSEENAIPIIIMTGQGDEKVAAAAIKSGAMDYIVKSPETFTDMPHVIERTLRGWQHIVERRQAENIFHDLATIFSSVTGEKFFSAVVSHLARMFDMDYAIIGELMESGDRVAVAGGYGHGQAMELPFEYNLAGTPCEQVIGQSFCVWTSGVQEQFPNDTLLAEMGVDGYMGSPLFDSAGNALGIIVLMHRQPIKRPKFSESILNIFSTRVSTEIERRRAEKTVRKLSQALEQAGESVLITDKKGIIEYINPAFTAITGYSASEAIGQTPRLLKSGEQDDAFYEAMWKTIAGGKVWQGKVVDRKKDGSFYPAKLTIAPVFDEFGDITHCTRFVGIQSDLTDLESIERQFHQAQKMEALGTLVGGIAHNFNNTLAGITGNLYLAKKQAKHIPDLMKRLTAVEQLSFRAASMIQQLLAFSRKSIISTKAMPLRPFIVETISLLKPTVPENIHLSQYICNDTLQINADASQIHQILINLVNNACDATEGMDKPCITIRLETFKTDDAFIEMHSYFKVGRYAHLSVEDNGCGIAEDQMKNVFEPFFTTKAVGRGTGLGLSMVFGAVKAHDGFINLESIESTGSTFHLYFPLLGDGKTVSEVQKKKKKEYAKGHGELILLADDEDQVRETTAAVLESLGYRVLQAADGRKALEIFKAHQDDIDLALLDVMMPHCSGPKLADQIKQINPEMKIIFSTGYDQNLQTELMNEVTLSKPFSIEGLSHLLRQNIQSENPQNEC